MEHGACAGDTKYWLIHDAENGLQDKSEYAVGLRSLAHKEKKRLQYVIAGSDTQALAPDRQVHSEEEMMFPQAAEAIRPYAPRINARTLPHGCSSWQLISLL